MKKISTVVAGIPTLNSSTKDRDTSHHNYKTQLCIIKCSKNTLLGTIDKIPALCLH